MHTQWFEPIRAYCERTDASYWAEPVNALSNGAFLVAAAAAARLAVGSGVDGRDEARDGPALALALLIGIVGIGSFLFHTHANRWSMLADVVPIGAFILGYFGLAMRRLLGLPPWAALAATLLFTAFNFGLPLALDAATGGAASRLTHGSIDYAPAALALFGVGAALRAGPRRTDSARRAGGTISAMGVLFLVSLTFRTLDAPVCARLPLGTHFLWHGLNACLLYGLVHAAVAYRRVRAEGRV